MATHWTLGCDANDPQLLASFWAQALRYVPEPGYEDPDVASIVDPDGRGPAIGFLRVPEGKTAKNRVHLDIEPTEGTREELVETAVAAGATLIGDHRTADGRGWVTLADPEGNEFCLQ